MTRWQREYDRNWRDYTRQVIGSRFGKFALQCYPIVTQADERQLREVLAEAGIKHAPLNHSRWHAPIPESQTTFDASVPQDFTISDKSYVYETPPHLDMFPPFSSQDFAPQTTPCRVSPSQRLQLRMAELSPISDNKRASSECVGTISPPSGAAKSPWTPGQWSPKSGEKTRQTPRRSLEASLEHDAYNLTAWSDGGIEEVQMEEDKAEHGQDAQIADVSKRHKVYVNFAVTSKEGQEKETAQCVYSDVNDLVIDADEMNVSKQLVFCSDDEQDDEQGDDEKKARTGAETDVAKVSKNVPAYSDNDERQLQQSHHLKNTIQKPSWSPAADFEFGSGNNEDWQQEDVMQDVEKHESTQFIVQRTDGSPTASQGVSESSQKDGENATKQNASLAKSKEMSGHAYAKCASEAEQNRLSTRNRPVLPSSTIPSLTETSRSSSTTLSTRNTSYAKPIHDANATATTSSTRRPAFASWMTLSAKRTSLASHLPSAKQTAQTPPTAPPSLKPAFSRKRTNRRALLHTKLPLEMEYRFARDRRRHDKRQKFLAAKPRVSSYIVPELLVELQPYQQEALQWMLLREKDPGDPDTIDQQRQGEATAIDFLVAKICGGILADEMGLGKTVCCLALICESLRQVRAADALVQSKMGRTIPRLIYPTLIITPLSILSQWEQEIRTKTNLSVVTYQGATRKNFYAATQFVGADIVLSTYDTLRLLECKVQDKGKNNDNELANDNGPGVRDGWHQAPRLTLLSQKSVVRSKLHQLQWFRVILDESHLIANAGCARAQAAFSLCCQRRWCVTGTPIQNRTADLAAMLQFVGLGDRTHALSERELGALVPRVVMRRLKSTLTANSRVPILKLPEKTEETIELEFASDVERALYMLLHRYTKTQVSRYLQSREAKQRHQVPLATPTEIGEESRPYIMHVFELILRLRQVCNACALVTTDPLVEVQTRAATAEALVGNGSDGISPFSLEELELLRRLQQHSNSERVVGHLESTKLSALMKELIKVRASRERVLVISQWTSFLDLITERLEAHNSQCETRVSSFEEEAGNTGISFAKLDGRMPAKDREQVVQNFQQHEDNVEMRPSMGRPLDVLLLSLRTGGLGLNLTAATHVFIMEPSWNPSLERQAIGRAHRFGQTRKVRVARFVVKGTIEERVVTLQNKKRQLTATLLGDGDIKSGAIRTRLHDTRLSPEDLRTLFFTQHEHKEELHLHQLEEGHDVATGRRDVNSEGSDSSVTCIEISD